MKKLFLVLTLSLFLAAGCQKQASVPAAKNAQPTQGANMITITSTAFEPGGSIPQKYSCKGLGVNPDLSFKNIPEQAKSLAIILHDPDAPAQGGFTHWVLFNIDPKTSFIPENSSPEGATAGNNGAGKSGYTAPCPPSGTHRYYFYVYALDSVLELPPGASKQQLEQAIEGHIIEQGELMGTVSN